MAAGGAECWYFRQLPHLAAALGILAAGAASADPEVSLVFDSMFGQQNFYQRCMPEDYQGDICTLPPNQYPPEGFLLPTGVDWLDGDTLVVADYGDNKLQVCDRQGACYWVGNDAVGPPPLRNVAGTFDLPHGVEVGPDGKVAVADEDNHAVQLCTLDGTCVYKGDAFTEDNDPGSGLGFWAYPDDVDFDSLGRIHGLDTGNNRIQVLLPPDLRFSRVYLKGGTAAGQVDHPRGIAIDAQDRVIIADTGNNRIQICENVLVAPTCSTFGSLGSASGQFNGPIGVDVDALGRIWVADTGNNRIQVCDYQGGCVAFGEFGDFDPRSETSEGTASEGPGRFNEPHDVAVDASGRVAVADTRNFRIQLFRTEAAFSINAGMSDAYYSPLTDGQGFLVSVWPASHKMFLAQFTFDVQRPDTGVLAILGGSGQRWVTGFGEYAGAVAVLQAELTTGMVFDSAEPQAVQTPGYGTYTVTFDDCMGGTIAYDFPQLELSGQIPIQRVAPDNVALCEALQGQ